MQSVRDSYRVVLGASLIKPEFRIITGEFGVTSSLFYTGSPNPLSFAFTCPANTTAMTLTGTNIVNGLQTALVPEGSTLVIYPSNAAPVIATISGVVAGDGITTGTLSAVLNRNYPVSGTACLLADAVTYTATGLPSGITINATTGIIGGAPLGAPQGDYPITITNSLGGQASFIYRIGSGIGTDVYPFPFIWTSACTEAWMAFIQLQEKRLRTITGTMGSQATNGTYSEIPAGENNWFYAPFNFTGYEGSTLIITDGGVDHYRTILSVDALNSNVVELDANYSFSASVAWSIPGAFRLPRASDVGRQCLCPEGLQFREEGFIIANYDAIGTVPVLRAFQPWMIAAGIYVADDDFAVPQAYNDSIAPVIYAVPQPTPPVVTSETITKSAGTSFTYQINGTGNLPFTYYDTPSGLPYGMTINHTTGVISGNGSVSLGSHSIPISITNAYGTGTGTLTLIIARAINAYVPNQNPVYNLALASIEFAIDGGAWFQPATSPNTYNLTLYPVISQLKVRVTSSIGSFTGTNAENLFFVNVVIAAVDGLGVHVNTGSQFSATGIITITNAQVGNGLAIQALDGVKGIYSNIPNCTAFGINEVQNLNGNPGNQGAPDQYYFNNNLNEFNGYTSGEIQILGNLNSNSGTVQVLNGGPIVVEAIYNVS